MQALVWFTMKKSRALHVRRDLYLCCFNPSSRHWGPRFKSLWSRQLYWFSRTPFQPKAISIGVSVGQVPSSCYCAVCFLSKRPMGPRVDVTIVTGTSFWLWIPSWQDIYRSAHITLDVCYCWMQNKCLRLSFYTPTYRAISFLHCNEIVCDVGTQVYY